jgi:DNA polymerase/3'-5' exonuclease PolX
VKKEFEAWLQSEEYKKMEEVHKELKGIGQMISETSVDSDLSGKFQTLWDLIYEFAVLLKIKPPFKRI